jgi:hypothetical protein
MGPKLASMSTGTRTDQGIPFDADRGYRRPMELRILGPLEVIDGNGPIALGGPKQQAVLAHLLLRTTWSRPRS